MPENNNRIRELRLARSLNQEQLADALGVTKQAISQMERGVRNPSMLMLEALCDFFNVSADYLLGKDPVTLRYVDIDGIKRLDRVPNSEHVESYYLDEEAAEYAQAIFEDPDLKALFHVARSISKEDLKLMIDMGRRFKETANE